MEVPTLFLILFNIFILFMLVLDLGVMHRKVHVVTVKEALTWVGVWMGLAMVFCVVLYFWHGSEASLTFLTGYLIEQSLSVDNIFVIIMIFSYFAVPPRFHHKILFWGILGAIAMRAAFIVGGIHLINKFSWIIYVFGIFLVYSGVKMALQKEGEEIDFEKNPVMKLIRKILPITDSDETGRFFVRKNGKLFATNLFVVLMIVEFTDLVFAMDSIPAIIAVTRDSFLVYTSNVFAILGLRSLYFALVGMTQQFHYLKFGVAFILVFVGVKMAIADFFHVPILAALGMIVFSLGASIVASIMFPAKEK